MRPYRFRGHKTIQELLADSRRPLERDVMAVVWAGGEMTVKDVCERLDSVVAYTTVMTAMDRLFKIRALDRRKVGQAFMYRARLTEHELDCALAANAVRSILQQDGMDQSPSLSLLVDTVSAQDPSLLDALERLVREKRRAHEHTESG